MHNFAPRACLAPLPPSGLAAAMENLATPHPVDPIADLNVVRAAATHSPEVVASQVSAARPDVLVAASWTRAGAYRP